MLQLSFPFERPEMQTSDLITAFNADTDAEATRLTNIVHTSLTDDVSRFAAALTRGITQDELDLIGGREFPEAITQAAGSQLGYGIAALSWLCSKVAPGVAPFVTSEATGREIEISVSVANQYIGAITASLGGGAAACQLQSTWRVGCIVTVDGSLANRYLCGDPSHHEGAQ